MKTKTWIDQTFLHDIAKWIEQNSIGNNPEIKEVISFSHGISIKQYGSAGDVTRYHALLIYK